MNYEELLDKFIEEGPYKDVESLGRKGIIHAMQISVQEYKKEEEERIKARKEDIDWVKEDYIKMFKEKNPRIPPCTKATMDRMRYFIEVHPEYSKGDILKATQDYIDSADAMYTKRPHYFIMKGSGAEKISELLEWLTSNKEKEIKSVNVTDKTKVIS